MVERHHPRREVFRDDCLAGRTMFVTGASSGIGRSAAIALSRVGARVVVNGRDATRLADTIAAMAGTGHAAVAGVLDNADTAAELVKDAARTHGRFDGIFHAAGAYMIRPIKVTKQAQIDEAYNASVFGAYGIARAVASKLVLANGGSVLLMASIAGVRGNTGLAAYSGAKAAVIGLTRVVALELASRLVRVNALVASTVTTEMHERTIADGDAALVAINEGKHPLGFGAPAQIDDAVIFLLSDASTWVTGAAITVDGGYLAG